MIYLSKIVDAGKDFTNGFFQKVFYRGKTANALIVYPFGYHANANNDSIVLTFGVNGQAENRAGIPWDLKNRPVLKQGEIALYQPAANITTIIKFDESGNILMDTNADLIANCKNATITATTKITGTAPDIEWVGNTKITGDFEVTGDTTLGSNVTSNGKDISDTHGHAQGNDSAGDSQVNISGVL